MKAWLKVLLVTASAVALTFSTVVQADLIREENPYDLLRKVQNATLQRIENDRSKIDEDINYIREVIREELMPYVDSVYASKRVLGRNLLDTNESQRKEFYSVFREYLIATYARAFTQYDETKHTIEIEPARDVSPESKMVEVNTRLLEQGRPPVRLDFKMRYDNDENRWKAYDLVVEGVSLLNSKQAEISSVIRDRGIDGTIELLREKANDPITAYDEESAE